jgi:hypothetical protein
LTPPEASDCVGARDGAAGATVVGGGAAVGAGCCPAPGAINGSPPPPEPGCPWFGTTLAPGDGGFRGAGGDGCVLGGVLQPAPVDVSQALATPLTDHSA